MVAPIDKLGAEHFLQFEFWLANVIGSKYRDDVGIHEWSPDERLECGPGLRVPQALLEDHLLTLYRCEKVRYIGSYAR